MSKSTVKTNRISGARVAVMIISILLLSLIMAFSMLLGISSLKQHGPVQIGDDATTVRKKLPSDGTLPTDATPLDNIGYMAYVLDHQQFFHSYAYNSTKSTGYEQVTQSWKDFKNEDLSGVGLPVMVASDLSFSALIKSSSQSCFIGDNEAHVRGGNKPGKNSLPLDIEWSGNKPTIYNKESFKYAYGEFATEISVYVINQDTLISAEEVVDNGDGTYSQKFLLNENAGCWYQYGMKTRGGLKSFPEFKNIEITFKFDANWRILESYCEEKAIINPRALGGMDMVSNSKTTTTFNYTEEGFDEQHYAYFDNFFKKYQGSKPEDNEPVEEEPDILEILGSGFSKVLDGGQQFNLDITLGDTAYIGKVFLSLPDMGDVLNSLDARVALEKKGSGKQDFYAEFKNGKVNVYYSTDFALTADIDEISSSVGKITEWVKGLTATPKTGAKLSLAADEADGGIDIGSLTNDLKKAVLTDTEAIITLQSENLLGLGIGIDVALGFDRNKTDDNDTFAVRSLDLNYVKYNGTAVDLKAAIVPDDGETITRNAQQTPANLADYIDSVYKILSSNTIKVDIGLDDKLIEGLTLDAAAYVAIGTDIALGVDVSALYKGISLKLDARYIYDKTGYGKLYLRVTEINGKEVDAKVYCDIADAVNSVKDIISIFNGGGQPEAQAITDELADIVNKVLNLNFSKIIGKVSGNNEALSLEVNVDELLSGLGVSLGIDFGTLALTVDNVNKSICGSVSGLGLSINICGSDYTLAEIENIGSYVDLGVYLDSVNSLLRKPSYDISIDLAGTKISDGIDLSSLKVNGVATVAIENGTIRVKLPLTVAYGDYGINLTAYYTVNLSEGTYGKIYLNVTSVTVSGENITLDAKAYCDIKSVVDGVKEIISKLTPSQTAALSGETDVIAKAIETVLKLDFNEIINATNEKLSVELNVDEILSGLEISLGGISFGNLKLEFVTATGSLNGSLEKLGLTVSVNGNDNNLADFATDGYVDLGVYLDSINALLSKKSYNFELSLTGNGNISPSVDLTGLSLDASVQLALADGFKGINVNISNLRVAYKQVSLELSARYEVSFDGGYGVIYLDILKVNGEQVDGVKVKLDITDAVNSVKNIINAFKAPEVQTYAQQTDIVAKIINGVLKLNFNELLGVTDERANVKLDLDALLSEFDLGLNLGVLELEYVPADFTLTGSDELIGLNLIKITGSDEELAAFAPAGYIDLNAFISGVEGIVNSDIYEISLNFNGGKITDGIDLSGLKVGATAYARLENGYNNITVYLPVRISYASLAVELCVYYSADINNKDFSTVFINVTKIGDVSFDIKLYCDIQETIAAVKDIINSFNQPSALSEEVTAESADIISKVVGILLDLDYAEMIKGSQNNLSVTVDVDDILSKLDISLGGISFGSLQLGITLSDNCAVIGGRLEKLGVEISLKGNDSFAMPAEPVKGDYLDLTAALRLVEDMISEGKAIAEAEDISFVIDATASIDGTPIEVRGNGEISCKNNSVKVAVSLSVAVDGETLSVNFVYDETVTDGPFVIITVNEIGVKVRRSEIDKLTNSIKGLIDSFKSPSADAPEVSAYAIGVGGKTLEEILKNDNVKKALNAILGILNEFTVELEGDAENALYNLIVKHSGGLTVTLGTDGCLALNVKKADVLDLGASVEAGNGTVASSILAELADEKTEANPDGRYTYYELSKFIKKLYLGLFDKIEEISLKELLGDGGYSVKLNISGKDSGIEALEGVSVKAELYYDEGVDGTQIATKLLHASLDLNINGTAVLATASYKGRTVYIGLDKIGATTLTGIRFKAGVENIYDAAEELVRLITDTNLVETIGKFTGKGGTVSAGDIENVSGFAALTTENGDEAPDMLTKLLDALLTLNLEKAFKFDKNTNTAEINVDGITEALFGVKIGTVNAQFDGEKKSLSAHIAHENAAAWLTLGAQPCDRKSEVINPDDYMDISFISDLLSDLVNTITDDGKNIYGLYTFTGSIAVNVKDIPVLGSLDINFKNATITVGLDGNDKFYLSLGASMQKTTAIGFTVTENKDISITYSDGLVVLGRDIGTNKEIYKVLTLEYLLDNMLDKNNSPLRWLLGTSETVWGILIDQLKLNIDSGLTKPKTYTLYEQLQQNVKENKFNLFDYLAGVSVKSDNEILSVFGDGAAVAVEKFNLSDNYYALDLNAKKLTGGVLSSLCAVITRNDGGLSGIKAYGAIEGSPNVSFTLDFGTYLEGVTEVYGGKNLVLTEVNVDENSFYNDYAAAEGVTNENFGEKVYYKYDADSGEVVRAEAFEEGVTYFIKVNTEHYIKVGDGAQLATEYVAGTQYYKYTETDSTASLGEVALRNYLAYVTEKYGFDANHPFNNDTAHINKIFGCYNSDNNSYESSNVLETIYLDVYSSTEAGAPERTLEVLYGSTVKLISDFPEFADDDKTLKLYYVNADGEHLGNSIVIDDNSFIINYVDGKGRVSIYKASENAVEVIFNFVGIEDMKPVSAAFAVGDILAEYELNDYSFLGWYKDEELNVPVLNSKVNRGDIVDGKLTVYGKYIKSVYEGENGVNYTFDAKLEGGKGGYYVSGVNANITKYYNNANAWLEIASEINGYPVKYIGSEAFKNEENDIAHSLVNVLVPDTVVAVYDRAFLDNKGLKQVAFCAEKVFFGGRADSNGKTSVFYGCYPGNASNNNSFTVYYNGTQNNPYSYVSTTNNVIDGAWNRIYFNKPAIGSSTSYTMQTKSGGWSFAKFDVEIINLDGTNALPENAELSGILFDGIHFTAYAEAGYIANELEELLKAQLGKNIYDVTVSGALPINGKAHAIKVTITEHEEIIATTNDITVIVNFGENNVHTGVVEGVEANATLSDIYNDFAFDGKADYAFMGWYRDEALTQHAPLTNDGSVTTLYAKVVKRSVTVNGVVYGFVEESGNTSAHYAVSGFDASKADKDYTDLNAWLILENEISGIKVTEILSNALAGKGLKNVIVPANITSIGSRAFYNNTDIRNVAFTADSVYFDGTGDNTVFYGCATTSGGTNTNISVYYNSMSAAAGDSWGLFGKDSHIGRNGKGNAVSSGWYFVSFNYAGDVPEGFSAFTVGIKTESQSAEQLKAAAIAHINADTQAYGYINGTSVTVSGGYETVGKINEIIVSFAVGTPYYKVAFDSAVVGSKLVGDGVEYYNGNAYARHGSSVTLIAPDGYEFVFVTVDGVDLAAQADGSYAFTMNANSTVTVSGECKKVGIKTTTVTSAVNYTYDGKAYAGGNTVTVNDVEEGITALKEISAEGYVLIGWAYDDGSRMILTNSSVVISSAYYAVWAVERNEITSYSLNGSSLADVSVTVNGDNAAGFYGWYAETDTQFTTKLSEVSHENTVLNARVLFKLSYTLKGSGDNFFFYNNDDVNNKNHGIHGSENTKTINVLEGTSIQVKLADNTTQLIINYNNGNERVDESARAKQRKNFLGIISIGNSQKFTLPSEISENTDYKITENFNFTVAF